jgi:hypothetical protein
MAKSNTLAALSKAAGKKTVTKPGPVAVAKPQPATVLIQGHFAPEVRTAILKVRVETGRNVRQLLGEAINDLCAKYGVTEPYIEGA